MSQICDPILIPQHPLPRKRLLDLNLPAMEDVFADFRTAAAGAPIGLKLTVIRRENVLCALSPATLLLSQGPGQEIAETSLHDALRIPELLDALEIAIHATTMIQDVGKIRWAKYGWQSSSEMEGYFLRELWVFPQAALLLDNIHAGYVDVVSDLAYLGLVLHEPPRSNHHAVGLAAYTNALLKIAATAAVADVIEEWPEGVPAGAVPYARIGPSDLGPITP